MSSAFRRLSRDIEQARDHYDVVVVGSGYGGGVAALRFAQAGHSVAVLERGVERIPGEFPDSLREAINEAQIVARDQRLGNATGLFDLRVQEDLSVLVGCGLGGTSLINANVMLEPEPAVFTAPEWPQAIRSGTPALDAGFALAREMFAATPTPTDVRLAKVEALVTQAASVSGAVSRPPVAVNFVAESRNPAQVLQPACTLCGDCCSGCNVGAKNTVAMNYLPAARSHGAELLTNAEVRALTSGDGAWTLQGRHSTTHIPFELKSSTVVLAAGSLGSTEILLRSRELGLSVSDRLGRDLSGNGDVIAFGYNNDVVVNGVGVGHPARASQDVVGPVIAGLVDLRISDRLTDNIVIEEGALPSLLAPLLPAMLTGAAPLFGEDMDSGDFIRETAQSLHSLVKGAYTGAVNRTQTYLVMGHEQSRGEISLSEDRVRVDWSDVGQDPVFAYIHDTLAKATAATGGTLVPNPIWSEWLGRNLISVHPLGGCGMGDDAANGVVNHYGGVYDGREQGDSMHPGLFVLDGAIVPRSLGVNPALTIAALAERAVALICDDPNE